MLVEAPGPHPQAGQVAPRALAAEAQPPPELRPLAAALPQRCQGGLCERCPLRLRVTQLPESAAGLSLLQGAPSWLEQQEQEQGRLPEADLSQISQRLRLRPPHPLAVERRRMSVTHSVPK